jgi:DNA-binding transcriptional LysR family regulator
MAMTLQQLIYFLAVARTHSFTRAASESHVAQPSLSKQIRTLETELGADLFSRAPGNVALTPSGRALLPIAERILSDVDSARLEVQELAGLRRGRVRVGATPSLCTSLFADILRHFHDAFPGIEMFVQESGSRDLARDLVRGELDLALVIASTRRDESVLATTPLLRESLLLVEPVNAAPVPAEFPLAELADRPLVMFRAGYDLREATLVACQHAGFRPTFAIEGGEMDAVLRFVEAGLGPAIVPSMVLGGHPGLRGTPISPPLHRTVALAHRGDVTLTHAAHAFRTVLLEFLGTAELPPGVDRA